MLDMAQYGVVYVPYGMVQYGVVYVPYGTARYGIVWCGLCAVWYMVWYSVTHPIPLPGRWIQ